jgi:hypothetical protein
MSENSSINTLIGTFSSINSLNNVTIVSNNLICIDTANNRIGINTTDPSYSIHIAYNSSNTIYNGIYTPRLYFDLERLPVGDSALLKVGEVYRDSTGILKVKLP